MDADACKSVMDEETDKIEDEPAFVCVSRGPDVASPSNQTPLWVGCGRRPTHLPCWMIEIYRPLTGVAGVARGLGG